MLHFNSPQSAHAPFVHTKKTKQVLCVSSRSHCQVTAAGAATHLSVDVKKVAGLVVTLPLLVSSPLRVALCLGFLWRELGPAVLVGVTVLLFLIPVHSAVERRVKLLKVKRKGGVGWGGGVAWRIMYFYGGV